MALRYNRTAATSYAARFWDKPCNDGFVCVGSTSACATAARVPYVKVPKSSINASDVSAPSETVKDPSGKSVVAWDCLEDAAHFVSCCIGSPPGEHGGGIAVGAGGKGGPPGAPYGRLDANDLVRFLDGAAGVTKLLDKSTTTTLPSGVEGGDVIAYFSKKAKAFTHAALLMGDGKIAAHASRAAGSISRSPTSGVEAGWDYLKGNPDFSWSLYHFSSPPTIPPFRAAPYVLELGDEVGAGTKAIEETLDTIRTGTQFGALPFALVDLTGTPAQVPFSSNHDEDELYVASLAKICGMYAAFEMRTRIRQVVTQEKLATGKPDWGKAAAKFVSDRWAPVLEDAFPGLPFSPPRLDEIFTFGPGDQIEFTTAPTKLAPAELLEQRLIDLEADTKKNAGEIATTRTKLDRLIDSLAFREQMLLMLRFSDNHAASRCIEKLGFSYINGALRAAGFFSSGEGLALVGNYAGRWASSAEVPIHPARWFWKDPAGSGKTTNYAGSARQIARLMSLLALGILCADKPPEPKLSQEMQDMLRQDGRKTGKRIGIGSYAGTALGRIVASKIGYGDDKRSHDCAIVTRSGPHFEPLVYVVVGLGDTSDQQATLGGLFVSLDAVLLAAHA